MTREEKLMKVHALLAEVSDVLVDRFFDVDSEELLDEKIGRKRRSNTLHRRVR